MQNQARFITATGARKKGIFLSSIFSFNFHKNCLTLLETLIEKELGANEEMVVNKNSIFAFSSKVRFTLPPRSGQSTTLPLVRVKGPGTFF